MALGLADRVRETSTTTGTGAFTLNGAVVGYQAFSVIGNANTTYYTITDASGNWEVGIGTYTLAGTSLTRTTVISSSNAGALVNFPAGSKDVFVTYPAAYAVNATNNPGTAGQILASNGVGIAPTWVANSSTILLGTLTTTSGTAQTLSGLTLTPYKTLLVVLNNVSHSSGTGQTFRMAGIDAQNNTLGAANSLWGTINVDLSTGAFASNLGLTTTTAGTASANNTAGAAGNNAVVNATTSITFAFSAAGTFDAGTITVYGVR